MPTTKPLCGGGEKNILSGSIWTFCLLIVISSVLGIVLFATIHNRSESDLIKHTPERYNLLIKFWQQRGYFTHGGLWVWSAEAGPGYWNPPVGDESVKLVYRSYTMGHLVFANAIERLYMSITDSFSNTLMKYHNQFFTFLSSALLGLLAFRIGKRLGMFAETAMLSAISCLLIYQTFPINLFYYWEVYPSTIAIPFLLLFILTLENIYNNISPSRRAIIVAATSAFFIFYTDPPVGGLFLLFVSLGWFKFGSRVALKNSALKVLVVPIVIGVLVYLAQLALIKFNYPDIKFIGSGFWFRTGLDGSIQYYKDHWALLTQRSQFPFLKWYFLLIGGACSLLFFMFAFAKYVKDNYIALVLFCLLSSYLPIAFVASQGVIIHPYYFDAYLAVSMVLLLFCITPFILEKIYSRWGGFSLFFLTLAFCYTFVQLRMYMVAYPRA